jgi:hypothetical protein
VDAAQAGAAAATKGLGLTAGKPVTKAQRERGERAFIDRYMEVGVPMVIEGYLKRGDIKGAMAYQEFMDAHSTRAAMRDYASAMFDAATGNFDGFVDRMMDLYNNEAYFPDGMTVNKSKSRIVEDDYGRPTGALLVMTDRSGKETERIVTADDMLALGATILAPENAATYWMEQRKAAAEAQRGIAEDARKAAAEEARSLRDMALEIFKAKSALDPNYTMAQAMQEAQGAVGVGSIARPDAAPPYVLYRPQP